MYGINNKLLSTILGFLFAYAFLWPALGKNNARLPQGLDGEGVQVRFIEVDDGTPAPSDWDAAAERAKAFSSELQHEEKIILVTGNSTTLQGCVGNIAPIPRVGFPGLCYMDGPQAINRADGVSIFPSGVSAGATWDRDLLLQRGIALGEEFKAKGAHVMLG